MSALFIRVDGMTSPTPSSQVTIDLTVYVEGQASPFSHNVSVQYADTAESINDAIRSSCAARAVVLGHSVSSADIKRLLGGAHSDET